MPVYLDNAATTRVCPEAARAALEAMTEGYGNPSSGYALGQAAAAALKEHRAAVAGRLGCAPEELDRHLLRHRGGQLGRPGRLLSMDGGYGPAHRHHRRGARTPCWSRCQVSWPPRRAGRSPTILPDQSGDVSADARSGGAAARHGAGVHDAGEQRAGHPSTPWRRPPSPSGTPAPPKKPCSTATRCKAFLKVPFTPAELGERTSSPSQRP